MKLILKQDKKDCVWGRGENTHEFSLEMYPDVIFM